MLRSKVSIYDVYDNRLIGWMYRMDQDQYWRSDAPLTAYFGCNLIVPTHVGTLEVLERVDELLMFRAALLRSHL